MKIFNLLYYATNLNYKHLKKIIYKRFLFLTKIKEHLLLYCSKTDSYCMVYKNTIALFFKTLLN